MMNGSTVFFRLLADENKGETLAEAIASVHGPDGLSPAVHDVDPASFRLVPAAPFAYWVDQSLRRRFADLPPFQSDGRTARRGPSTGDDFRRVRAWWEVPAWRIGRTRRWAPFSKGGSFSPFFTDIHLVVAWDESRRTFAEFFGRPGRMIEKPESLEYFFRSGITWPKLPHKRGSFQVLPTGCVFSHGGMGLFAPPDQLLPLVGLLNSSAYLGMLSLLMARGTQGGQTMKYEAGYVTAVPLPLRPSDSAEVVAIGEAARANVLLMRKIDAFSELSHSYVCHGILLHRKRTLLDSSLAFLGQLREIWASVEKNQERIDDIACSLYGLTHRERSQLQGSLSIGVETDETDALDGAADGDGEQETDDQDHLTDIEVADPQQLVRELISYATGCSFGRWDVRIGSNPTLAPKVTDPFDPLPVCSAGALVGPDGLPAGPSAIASESWLEARSDAVTLPPDGLVEHPSIADTKYPLRLAWDGILVDDPDHLEDVVHGAQEVFGLIWRESGASIEREACDILEVADLRIYFRRPGLFFADHLNRYSKSRRKAPIYWPLSTASGSYTVWLYYQRLTSDTLFTAINRYIQPKIADLERELREAREAHSRATGRDASRLLTRIEELTTFLAELNALRDELLRVTQLPYWPNLDDGVIINAAPLNKLFHLPKWAKDTREVWQKLERGEYDWAHMAYTIWPDRVREKCRSDRSLAIAHDLEHLYSEPPPSAPKRRARAATLALDEHDE